jgi:hypothetical protein
LEIGIENKLTLNLIFQILVPSGPFDPEIFQTPKTGDSLILVFKYPETAGIIKKIKYPPHTGLRVFYNGT